jgi:hypothetical protein
MRHVGFAIALMLLAGGADAQAPRDVSDLVGARGAGGERELNQRGYQFVQTRTGEDRKWSYWWQPGQRRCISVTTVDGRYDAILEAPIQYCGKGPRDGRAVDRDDGYHPDIGFRVPPAQAGAPSFADRGEGGQPQGAALGLVCFGDGQRPALATTYGWTWDDRRDRYRYGNRTDLTQEQFDASIMLQFASGGGRVRLPKKLIPPIHSRGTEDWWDLYDVVMSPDTITASYRLNGLNKPRVTIDRRSGRITIVGTASYAFRGRCDLADEAPARKF